MAYKDPRNATSKKKEPLPEAASRKGQGKMEKGELRRLMNGMLADAHNFVDTELSPERAKATQAYKAEKVGDLAPEEGRSSFVLSEVRDVVDATIPSFARVIFGAERVLEFVPKTADSVERAKQKTDYVRYVFMEDNPGFLNTLAVWKDGLIRRMGIFKWGWKETSEIKTLELERVPYSELEAVLIAEEDNVEVELVDSTIVQEAVPPMSPEDPGLEALYDATVRYTIKDGRAYHDAVPPEEFWMDRNARTIEDALLIAHATHKTRGELIDMGISEKLIDQYGGEDITLEESIENIARHDTVVRGGDDSNMGKANDKILYVEAYPLIDYDGDGVAELRKICTIGPTFYPVSNHAVNRRPFAVYVPFPEPHTLVGNSLADKAMDMQRTKSLVMRSIFDSLSQSIFPRMSYQQGYANVQDILNTAMGAPIRTTKERAVEVHTTPFVGADAMPVMELLNGIMTRRIGLDPAVGGPLDPDALQSTTKTGVEASVQQSHAQIELMLRIFIEGTLKPLFLGLSELLAEHQPRSRMVKIRGTWVEVDPRGWDESDITVRAGVGLGHVDRKIAVLTGVAADQEQILSTLGPTNPIVTLGMWRNTKAKILELSDLPDTEEYYKVVPPDWQPPEPPAPPPSPEEILAQATLEAEKLKAQRDFIIKQAELEQEREQMRLEHEFNLRKLELESELKLLEIQTKNANAEADRVSEIEVRRDIEGAHAEIEQSDREEAQRLAREQAAAEQAAREREVAAAEQQAAAAAQAPTTEGA